jgi:hypothetical protein
MLTAHRGRKLNFLFTIQHYYGEITTEGGGGGMEGCIGGGGVGEVGVGWGYQATSEACRATTHMQPNRTGKVLEEGHDFKLSS